VSGSNLTLLQSCRPKDSIDYPGARLRCSYSENLSTELLRTFSASELLDAFHLPAKLFLRKLRVTTDLRIASATVDASVVR
jgi:hypothetical protein